MSVWKIAIPSGMVVVFLIVGFLFLGLGRGPTAPKTEVLQTRDKVSEKMIASRTPAGEINSNAQNRGKTSKASKELVIPPEGKKEGMPQESKEVALLSPRQFPSAGEREPEAKKEPPREMLQESRVPARVEKKLPAEKESESKEKLAPQGVMKSEIPEAKKASKEVPREVPKQIPQQIPKEVAKEIPKEVSKETPKQVAMEVPIEVSKEVPKEAPIRVAQEIPKEVPKDIPREVPREIPKQVAKEIPKETPKEVIQEVPKQLPKEVPTVTFHPGENLTLWTKGERVVSSRPSLLAREEEVQQFFSNYVDRYNRKDVGGFLSFFSSKAVQNQTDGLEAIGNLYTKFIQQSEELRYQIEGMKIEISQHRIDVRARFRTAQKLKKDGEEKVWKGNIRWVLVKEEGRLKILSVDYQNEKSP